MVLASYPWDELPEEFGFRNGERGVHSSRSMMYNDLARLLDATQRDDSHRGYRDELEAENVLGKRTATNTTHTARKLRALYGLDPRITVFRLLRHFWDLDDGAGRPVMALLCATSRDPLLRSLTTTLLTTQHGHALARDSLEMTLNEIVGARFSEATKRSSVSNILATWTRSGHLEHRSRIRRRPRITPAALGYAIALGYLEGRRGIFLFDSLWARLLDAPLDELRELAKAASINGWIVYREAGDLVEVRFPDLWTPDERERLDD